MDIPDCMAVEEIRITTLDDKHMSKLSKLILHGWPSTKHEVQKDLQPCWTLRNEIAIIDGIAVKG